MAGSRLPNFGTIFSRATGLLETGALKEKPLWYDVYKKFPPDVEPIADRPVPPQNPIVEIVYEEDFERAKKARVENSVKRTGINTNKVDRPKKQIVDEVINDGVSRDKDT